MNAELEVQHKKKEKMSSDNQYVLGVTTVAFGVFVIAEIVGAVSGHSLSLLGDAAAMSVDVFTYICNMWAENMKSNSGLMDVSTRRTIEVYIPLFSVAMLLAVSFYIAGEAVEVLLNREKGDDDNTSVAMLWVFSTSNALIDVGSAVMFYLRRDEIFYQPCNSFTEEELEIQSLAEGKPTEKTDHIPEMMAQHRVVNLNMVSAMTHVGGDTLRTLSVFAAALVSSTTGASATVCDAWASIIILFTIILMIIPLVREIWHGMIRLQDQ